MTSVDSNVFLQIHNVLCRFFLSFDRKDWASMAECLCAQVEIDYASSGREQPSRMSGLDFVKRRQGAVDGLTKHHSFSNLLVEQTQDPRIVSARCNYLILRFDLSSPIDAATDNFYHSCGSYEFTCSEAQGSWRIASIKQNALQSWGNSSLHGSRPEARPKQRH